METGHPTEEPETQELDAIQRMNLERKIAAGIFVGLLLLFGIAHLLLKPEPRTESTYVPTFDEEGNLLEGERESVTEVDVYYGPPAL